jgi:hypothetical protein
MRTHSIVAVQPRQRRAVVRHALQRRSDEHVAVAVAIDVEPRSVEFVNVRRRAQIADERSAVSEKNKRTNESERRNDYFNINENVNRNSGNQCELTVY